MKGTLTVTGMAAVTGTAAVTGNAVTSLSNFLLRLSQLHIVLLLQFQKLQKY